MTLSKSKQLNWNKAKNDKKLSKPELESFVGTIDRISKGFCQLCKVNKIGEYHHSLYGSFGADKDDRSLMGICVPCHYAIHHGKDGGSQELRARAIVIGARNWRVHNG